MRRPDYHRREVAAVALVLALGLLLAAARTAVSSPPAALADGALDARPAPLDPNRADRASLAALPGVGPVTANRIVLGRPYARLEDLRGVLGDAAYERARPYLTLGP